MDTFFDKRQYLDRVRLDWGWSAELAEEVWERESFVDSKGHAWITITHNRKVGRPKLPIKEEEEEKSSS